MTRKRLERELTELTRRIQKLERFKSVGEFLAGLILALLIMLFMTRA